MNKKPAATGTEHPVLVLHYTRHEGIRHWLGFCECAPQARAMWWATGLEEIMKRKSKNITFEELDADA